GRLGLLLSRQLFKTFLSAIDGLMFGAFYQLLARPLELLATRKIPLATFEFGMLIHTLHSPNASRWSEISVLVCDGSVGACLSWICGRVWRTKFKQPANYTGSDLHHARSAKSGFVAWQSSA